MDVPPSRYKVVEQGRRLVVIDTWNGDRPVTRQAPRSEAPLRPTAPRQMRSGPAPRQSTGTGVDTPDAVITTQSWFDTKGPRRIKLDGSTQGMGLVVLMVVGMAAALVILMWGWPAVLVAGLILAQKPVRAGLRTGITAWLDTQPPG